MKQLFRSLGEIVAFKQTPNGILLSTDEADVRITVYSESVIRVYIEKKENDATELPYAVVAKPQNVEFEVKETESVIFIETSKIKVLISRKPLRISFTDLNG
ncbi:MAG: alpha-glucosidase, partial [Bacteroidia bacterium]